MAASYCLRLQAAVRGNYRRSVIDCRIPSLADPLLADGDVSVLSWMEKSGARYSDCSRKQGDALTILHNASHNIVRMRVYKSRRKASRYS